MYSNNYDIDNSREISNKELRSILIGILDKVADFCDNNKIRYYLSSGTLIGAIRHKGFIPWDDDIDLYMLRPDYERFIKEFDGIDEQYRVLSLNNIPNYPHAYAKVEDNRTQLIEHCDHPISIGVNIDIFPIDGVPDDVVIRRRYFSKISGFRRKLILKNVSINFKARGLIKNTVLLLGKICLLPWSITSIAHSFDSIIDKHCDDSQFVCNLIMGNGIGSEFRREAIRDFCEVEFERKKYKTMAGYDEYLKKTYGDYMQLPPEDKRVTHHDFTAYWK